MYMIAGLCMLKLYQKRHPDINASAYTAYACLALVIFFSVLGVVRFFLFFFLLWSPVASLILMLWMSALMMLAGVREREHGFLDRFLSHPHSGHAPPQHTAVLHGPMEAG